MTIEKLRSNDMPRPVGRPKGVPAVKRLLKIYVSKDCVFEVDIKKPIASSVDIVTKQRFVYAAIVSPKVRQLVSDDIKTYNRFHQLFTRGAYNTIIDRGLCAFNVDNPQDDESTISIPIKIIVGPEPSGYSEEEED
jgi:hypothetical protein